MRKGWWRMPCQSFLRGVTVNGTSRSGLPSHNGTCLEITGLCHICCPARRSRSWCRTTSRTEWRSNCGQSGWSTLACLETNSPQEASSEEASSAVTIHCGMTRTCEKKKHASYLQFSHAEQQSGGLLDKESNFEYFKAQPLTFQSPTLNFSKPNFEFFKAQL